MLLYIILFPLIASLSFSPSLSSKVSAFLCISFLSLSLLRASAISQQRETEQTRGTDSQRLSERESAMDDDWDLQAVVRGCSTSSAGAITASAGSAITTAASSSSFDFTADFLASPLFSPPSSLFCGQLQQSSSAGQLFSLPDPTLSARNVVVVEELHELYKPFYPKSQTSPLCPSSSSRSSTTTTTPINNYSSISSICSSTASINDQRVQINKQVHHHQQTTTKNSHIGNSSTSTTAPRSKKRKNQLKKVCEVPAESLSSDIWAWRKYGQKPIKGSPYPRGYYRCSSSKGCLARKQVERKRTDPGLFIVTYTAEHNHPAPTHRNSLAGSTRQKPSTPPAGDSNKLAPATTTKPCSPATSAEEDQLGVRQTQSTTTESKDGPESLLMEDDDEDEFGLSDMAVSDDFFVGLEGLGGPAAGDFFSDHFPTSFINLPWVANNAATAASGS